MGRKNLIGLILLAIFMGGLPWYLGDSYWVSVLIFIGIYCLITIGLSLLMGYCGQISIGHAAFYGIGAYTSGLLSVKAGWSPWLAMIVAILVSATLALLVGMPILRLRGHYLAMATLALGVVVYIFFEAAVGLTGGPSGFGSIPRLQIGSFKIKSDFAFYHLVWISVLCAMALALNIIHSRVGRALRSIHSSEIAARAMGVNAAWHKVQIFVLSAALASLAGSYYAHYMTFVSPSSFTFRFSVTLVTMVAVGGMSSLWGAVAGTVLLGSLPEILSDLEDYHLLIYGGILMVIMIFIPQGILLGLTQGIQKVTERLRGRKEAA